MCSYHDNHEIKCIHHIYGLVQDRSYSIANALELLLSWASPSIYPYPSNLSRISPVISKYTQHLVAVGVWIGVCEEPR